MTHDSIGLGEDGPTHQPVEHLASLRAMPNLNVFRPADADRDGGVLGAGAAGRRHALDPGADAPGRAGAAQRHGAENLCAKGAYVLAETAGKARDVTLLATGSEVGVAMEARERLAKDGIEAAVVSMPCWELFAAQPVAYRAGGAGRRAARRRRGRRRLRLGALARRAAASSSAWRASAPRRPAPKLYEHFGITPAKVADAARKLLSQ